MIAGILPEKERKKLEFFVKERKRERTQINNPRENSLSEAKVLFDKVLKEEKERLALKEMIEDLSYKKLVSYVPLPKRMTGISTGRGSTIDNSLKEKLQRETEFLKSRPFIFFKQSL